MKHLVIGGRGLIGSAVVRELINRKFDWIATVRYEAAVDNSRWFYLDLLEYKMFKPPKDVDVVYLIAATNSIRSCEGNEQAYTTNVDAPIALAKQFKGSTIVYISSDSVEWMSTTIYVKTKSLTEMFMQSIDAIIIRPFRVVPARAAECAKFIVDVGTARIPGVYRWM